MQEAPRQRVLGISALALGTPETREVGNVVDGDGGAVGGFAEEPVDEVAVRGALVGAQGDVRAREGGVVLDDLWARGVVSSCPCQCSWVIVDMVVLHGCSATHVQGVEVMQVDPAPSLVELCGRGGELVG